MVVVRRMHGLGAGVVMVSGGREWDAHELLGGVVGLRRRVGDVVGVSERVGGVKENKVAGGGRLLRRRCVGVGYVPRRVHEYEGLQSISCLDFRVPMKVRRHRILLFVCSI